MSFLINCGEKFHEEMNVTIETARGYIFDNLSKITTLVLFTVGMIGAAGIFPGTIMGWLTIGLGAGSFALSFAGGNLKKRKFILIFNSLLTFAFIATGSLGLTGVLTGAQMSAGVIGINLAILVQYLLVGLYLYFTPASDD